MAKSSTNGLKTQWEKVKLLITSNFFFSHSGFRRLVLQTHKNQGLFGKGLILYQTPFGFTPVIKQLLITFLENEKPEFFFELGQVKDFVKSLLLNTHLLFKPLASIDRGSVVMCLIRNPGVLDSSCMGCSEFFVGVSLGKTLQSPSIVLVKPRKDMNNVIPLYLEICDNIR